MSFNITEYSLSYLEKQWLRETKCEVEIYGSYDGGGFCGYILSFEKQEDRDLFISECNPGRIAPGIDGMAFEGTRYFRVPPEKLVDGSL